MSPASAYAVQLKSHKGPGDLPFQEEESKGSERLGASLKVTQPGRGRARASAALLVLSTSLPFVGIFSCASRSIAHLVHSVPPTCNPRGPTSTGKLALWFLVGFGHWEVPAGDKREFGEGGWGVYSIHSHPGRKVRKVKSLCRVRLFATPWIVASQASLPMGFSRQEYWSGLPFPSPGDLPDPGIKPGSPDTLLSEPPDTWPGDVPQKRPLLLSRW